MAKGKRTNPPPSTRPRRRTCPPRGTTIKTENLVADVDSDRNLEQQSEASTANQRKTGSNLQNSDSTEIQSPESQPGPSRRSKPFQVIINYIAPQSSAASQSTGNEGQGTSGMTISSGNDPLFITPDNPDPDDPDNPDEEGLEDPPQEILPDSEEYIEELVYVDLDEIPNIQELFSIRPDDHLLLQNRRQREKPFVPKPTVSDVTLKFYNLESDKPVLRLGKTFFTGRWLDSVGSSLFFNKKEKTSLKMKQDFEFVQLLNEGRNKTLNNLIPEKAGTSLDEILPDPVFREKESPTSFDLVANVKKVLKLTRRDLSGAESSTSARVIHDDARFMPSYYIDKEMRNKVEILQLLGKHSPKNFKFKWELGKRSDPDMKTEVKRRERTEDSDWEDISESDLSLDEGSSSSCDEVDEEAYEAYLKIREELNYETKNFNFNNKKGKVVETSESFKERYSAPYYLNRKRVVTRVNSMLARANMKKINYGSPSNYKRKKVSITPGSTDAKSSTDGNNISIVNLEEDLNSNAHSFSPTKSKNERFYKPTFRSREELLQKWKPSFNSDSTLKSTSTKLVLPEELKELIHGETSVGSDGESEKTMEACENLKTLSVSESKESAE